MIDEDERDESMCVENFNNLCDIDQFVCGKEIKYVRSSLHGGEVM